MLLGRISTTLHSLPLPVDFSTLTPSPSGYRLGVVLKPGGWLLFAENLKGSMLHRLLRKTFVRWANYWRYLVYRKDLDLFRDFIWQAGRSTAYFTSPASSPVPPSNGPCR